MLGTVGLALAAVAGGAYWWATREAPPLREEHEPNDDVAHANKIAAGTRVIGYLTGSMVSNVNSTIWFSSSTLHFPAYLPGRHFFCTFSKCLPDCNRRRNFRA